MHLLKTFIPHKRLSMKAIKKIIFSYTFFLGSHLFPQPTTDFFFVQNHYLFSGAQHYISSLFESRQALKGFDNNSNKLYLGDALFGSNIKLSDIFLTSYLSTKGKLTLPSGIFGSIPSEQFLACLSTTKIHFSLEQIDRTFTASYSHSINLSPRHELGLHGRIKTRQCQRRVNFMIQEGVIECTRKPQSVENSITQYFHTHNMDFSDLFVRDVLASKSICLQPIQEHTSLSSFTITSYLKRNPNPIGALLLGGFTIKIPFGHQSNESILWEIESKKSDVSFSLFSMLLYSSSFNPLNPFILCSIKFFPKTSLTARVPRIKNENSKIFTPSSFIKHTIEPFSHVDSSVPYFADHAIPCHKFQPAMIRINIGNIWENFFYKNLVLAGSLSGNYQDKSRLTNKEPTEDELLLHSSHHIRSHFQIKGQWSLSFDYHGTMKISIGSFHTLYGKNIPLFNGITFCISGFL